MGDNSLNTSLSDSAEVVTLSSTTDLETSSEVADSLPPEMDASNDAAASSTAEHEASSEIVISSTTDGEPSTDVINLSSTVDEDQDEIVTISSEHESEILENDGPNVEIPSGPAWNVFPDSPSAADVDGEGDASLQVHAVYEIGSDCDDDSDVTIQIPATYDIASDCDDEDEPIGHQPIVDVPIDEPIADEPVGDVPVGDEEGPDEESKVVSEIRKRKAETRKPMTSVVDSSYARDVAFHPSTAEVALAFNDRIEVYSVEDGEMVCLCSSLLSSPLTNIAYNYSGDTIYGLSRRKLMTFRKVNGELLVSSKDMFMQACNSIHTGETNLAAASDKGTLYMVKQATGQLESLIKLQVDQIDGVASRDEDIFVVAGPRVFRLSFTETSVRRQGRVNSYMNSALVHGPTLICGTIKGELLLFNRENLYCHGAFKISKERTITTMIEVSDSAIAVAFENGYIKMYTIFPNRALGVLGNMPTFAIHMSVSPDGNWLIANDSLDECRLFDLREVDDSPPVVKKQKCDPSKHLPSSSSENKGDFFSSLS